MKEVVSAYKGNRHKCIFSLQEINLKKTYNTIDKTYLYSRSSIWKNLQHELIKSLLKFSCLLTKFTVVQVYVHIIVRTDEKFHEGLLSRDFGGSLWY